VQSRIVLFLTLSLQSCCHIPFNKLDTIHDFSSSREREAMVNGQDIICISDHLEVRLNTKAQDRFKALDFTITNFSDSPLLICNSVSSWVSNNIFQIKSSPDLTMKSDLEFILLEPRKSIKLGAGIEELKPNEIALDLQIISNFQEYLHSGNIEKANLKIFCSDKNPIIIIPFDRHPDKGFTRLLIKGITFKPPQQGDVSYSFKNY